MKLQHVHTFLFTAFLLAVIHGCVGGVIRATPDWQEIHIGAVPADGIRLEAPAEVADCLSSGKCRLFWKPLADNAGRLEGDDNAPRIVYRPPDSIQGKRHTVHVQLEAEMKSGEKKSYYIWFTLISPYPNFEKTKDSPPPTGLKTSAGEYLRRKEGVETLCTELGAVSIDSPPPLELLSNLEATAQQCYEQYIYRQFQPNESEPEMDYGALYRQADDCLLAVLEKWLERSGEPLPIQQDPEQDPESIPAEAGTPLDADDAISGNEADRSSKCRILEEHLSLLRGALNVCRRSMAPDGKLTELREQLEKKIEQYETIAADLKCTAVSE